MLNKTKTPARQVTHEAPNGARKQPLVQENHQSVVEYLARGYSTLKPLVAADIPQVWRNALSSIEDRQRLTGLANTKAAKQIAPDEAKPKRARDLPRANQALAQDASSQQQQLAPQTPETPQPYHTCYGGNNDKERDHRIISWVNQTRQAENETEKTANPRKKHTPLDGANEVDDEEDSAVTQAEVKEALCCSYPRQTQPSYRS